MKPRLSRKTQGFSLVEVLLAMVVISIGLLGILALLTATVRSSSGSRSRETAVYLAQTLADDAQAEAHRLNLATSYGIPGASSAVGTYFTATAGTQYFDVDGAPTNAANKIFTVDWSRIATRDSAPNCFEFVARITWTSETNAGGTALVKTVQINRLIHIDS